MNSCRKTVGPAGVTIKGCLNLTVFFALLFLTACVSSSPSTWPNKKPRKISTPFILREVAFEKNSADLDSSDCYALDRVYNSLASYPSVKILIVGHTGGYGNRTSNTQLSQKRAKTVKEYLVARGISAERIITIGVGDSRPVYLTDHRKGTFPQIRNERIEILPEGYWRAYRNPIE